MKLSNVCRGIELVLERGIWLEVVTLVVPGFNDGKEELRAIARFLAGCSHDIPWHVTAFHPDYKMTDVAQTPPGTLKRARRIALDTGLHYVYVGNVHDPEGDSTYCPGCGERVIERDWYVLGEWNLDRDGRCSQCGTRIAGVFEDRPGGWGAKRLPVNMEKARSDDRALEGR